jgi:hypothetical protein
VLNQIFTIIYYSIKKFNKFNKFNKFILLGLTMTNKQKSYDILSSPTEALQAALDRLNLFTQIEEVRLDVSAAGELIITQETVLERTIGLARYLGRFFSESSRREHEKKLKLLKQAILQDRDIIQSHAFLIEKLKKGDSSEQKLANYALEAIQKYNEIVSKKNIHHNYDYQCLLEDKEIHGNQIQLPSINSVKIDSHPHDYPARKILEELSATLRFGASSPDCAAIQTTHKDSNQLMLDTFRMKAIRLIQEHLPHQLSDAETRQLVHQAPIYSHEEPLADVIHTHQKIETGPGSFIILTGSFKKQTGHSKFIMPALDMCLSAQYTHSGFPYPAQHTGWSLVDSVVEANPLRKDGLPLFHLIDQRKKQIVHQLLFDPKMIARARAHVKMIRDINNQHLPTFLNFHQQLQNKFLTFNPQANQWSKFLETFYETLKTLPSAFDYLTQLQQQFNHYFVKQPLKALEEKWFQPHSPLRLDSSEEKFEAITQFLNQEVMKASEQLADWSPNYNYLLCQEALLGPSLRSIHLLYCSEKMKFTPPQLTIFEKKLQACAFEQLLQFLNQIEHESFLLKADHVFSVLQMQWIKDLQFFEASDLMAFDPTLASLTHELNQYFYSRFDYSLS